MPETITPESPKKSGFREKNALLFVLITVGINSIGFGIMLPVLPDLIKELTGLGNDQAVLHLGGMTFIFALMQFICMPIVGGLSDAYGRRPVMLVSIGALALDYFLMALAPTVAILIWAVPYLVHSERPFQQRMPI